MIYYKYTYVVLRTHVDYTLARKCRTRRCGRRHGRAGGLRVPRHRAHQRRAHPRGAPPLPLLPSISTRIATCYPDQVGGPHLVLGLPQGAHQRRAHPRGAAALPPSPRFVPGLPHVILIKSRAPSPSTPGSALLPARSYLCAFACVCACACARGLIRGLRGRWQVFRAAVANGTVGLLEVAQKQARPRAARKASPPSPSCII